MSNEAPTFWAKSDAGGTPHSLIGHCLDTAAVAELLWDGYVPAALRDALNACSEQRGRDLLTMLAACHDLGKATPAFQFMLEGRPNLPGELTSTLTNLDAQGLTYDRRASRQGPHGQKWPHPHGSSVILNAFLASHQATGYEWVMPIIDGHHGIFMKAPGKPASRDERQLHGIGPAWHAAQQSLASRVLDEVGVDVTGWSLTTPNKAIQLTLAGYIVMCDWIASNSDLFPGLGLRDVAMDEARLRADRAWETLALSGGWSATTTLMTSADDFVSRFGFAPRPLQREAMAFVEEASNPGLLIIEDTMGAGKTEAALAAAELLASRHNCAGIAFAMPTQGTTDAMYDRVREWMSKVDDSIPVTLLHGKAMLNEGWAELLANTHVSAVGEDEFGMPDDYGCAPTTRSIHPRNPVPSQWILGKRRGLLSPSLVGTIDQLLWAATRTRYIQLRFAGLAGKVLVIDEVHSYDVFMGVFLTELLKWCAMLATPVVLMSATLTSETRAKLTNAWRSGLNLAPLPPESDPAYPRIEALSSDGTRLVRYPELFRPSAEVGVEVLESCDPNDLAPVIDAIDVETRDGGVTLAILNTVARAQQVWRGLQERGIPADLIHGRFTARERADRTARAVTELGKEAPRPDRRVIVATQIAEQSFDVDADILISDIAPIDLLLQRIGRVHRHDRDPHERPPRLRSPRVIVTGVSFNHDAAPSFATAFSAGDTPVYQPITLMASAHALMRARSWSVPGDTRQLLEEAYSPQHDWPHPWSDEADQARERLAAILEEKSQRASSHRLSGRQNDEHPDLTHLHFGISEASDEEGAMVRDIEDSTETVLIVKGEDGLRALDGTRLGVHGERASDPAIARKLMGDSIRIAARYGLCIEPLPEWVGLPLIGSTPVIVLAEGAPPSATFENWTISYENETGLTIQRERKRNTTFS